VFDIESWAFLNNHARALLCINADTAIQWGRYAELFDYTADDRELIFTRPEEEAHG
jgi:hypothetical protein